MLTRNQVARRLGKSIATVRRLEGSQLHPRRDASGVLRFDDTEVSRLAAALGSGSARLSAPASSVSAGRGARSEWFSGQASRDDAGLDADYSDEVESSVGNGESCVPAEADQIRLLEARVRELEGRVTREGREESAAREKRRMHGRMLREVLDELESLSDAEFRRLGPGQLEVIAHLIAKLL